MVDTEGRCDQLDPNRWRDTNLGGELVKGVSLDGVDRQGVVSVNGSETSGD